MLKRNVFKCFLKLGLLLHNIASAGKLFQVTSAAYENERCLQVVSNIIDDVDGVTQSANHVFYSAERCYGSCEFCSSL